MSNEFEYYKVHRKNDNDVPLLNPETGCPKYLYQKKAIENPELLTFKFGPPIPKKPKITDFHTSPYSVISSNIFNVLSVRNIYGVQLLACTIRGNNDKIYTDYWAVHAYQRIRCIDLANSDCIIDDVMISYVKKLALDKKTLKAIPLEKRLLFRLGEDSSYELYHISIMEAIINVNPGGIRFTDIEKWDAKSPFKK